MLGRKMKHVTRKGLGRAGNKMPSKPASTVMKKSRQPHVASSILAVPHWVVAQCQWLAEVAIGFARSVTTFTH